MTYIKLIFSLLFILPIYGQSVNFNKGKSIKKHFYTEINYTEIQGKIIIPAIIEGNTYHFLLDTGAPNLISFDLYKKIKSKSIKTITVKDANNKKMKMQIVSMPLIKIGDVTFKNTPTIVNHSSTNFIFDCFEVDGIIGSNLLRNSIIQFLPKIKTIKISSDTDKIKYNENKAMNLSLHGKQSSPYIRIDLQGRNSVRELVLFDTGMKGFYDLSKRKYDDLKSKDIFIKLEEATGTESIGLFGPSNIKKQYRLIISQIKVGNAGFKNIFITTTSAKHSRIGSDILKYGSVILDYKNKKFVFEPFQESVDLNEKILGISFNIIDDQLVVGMVWEGKLKNEISFGDKIVSINGVDFRKINVCDIITKESIFKKNDTLNIEFENNKGIVKRIKLIKEDPLKEMLLK
ncbi:MAG: retroviral-like aspartic protease family protein [Flavobacteriaceae bacterium]|nr:retroviral-like aspartic protease family protein [Flavobacteriaceae bacterium]